MNTPVIYKPFLCFCSTVAYGFVDDRWSIIIYLTPSYFKDLCLLFFCVNFANIFYHCICISYCSYVFLLSPPLPPDIIEVPDLRDWFFIASQYVNRENEYFLIGDHLWHSTGQLSYTHKLFKFIFATGGRYCYYSHFTGDKTEGHNVPTFTELEKKAEPTS